MLSPRNSFVYLVAALAIVAQWSLRTEAQTSSGDRYGFLNLLDHRSVYGKGEFPEPFLVDDSDLEHNELRFDELHRQRKGAIGDNGRFELEKGIGLMTLEFEATYSSERTRSFDAIAARTRTRRDQGFGNVAIGARHPVYQYVSADETIDSTFGVGLELGIPVNSPVSKHTEIVPKIFNDLRLGDHFTLQTVLGYSLVRGSRPDGGSEAFEYGLVFGYAIEHRELPLPGVDRLIPVFELKGDTATNHGAGHNSLLGNIAVRFNLRAIGAVQPRLGLGYVFPMDKGARDDLRWGVYTSLVFDF